MTDNRIRPTDDEGRAALGQLLQAHGDPAVQATLAAWIGDLIEDRDAGVLPPDVKCWHCGVQNPRCDEDGCSTCCGVDLPTSVRWAWDVLATEAAAAQRREDRDADLLKAAQRDQQRMAASVEAAYAELLELGGEEAIDRVTERARKAGQALSLPRPTYWDLYGVVIAAQGALRETLATLEDEGAGGVARVVEELNGLLEAGHLEPDFRRLGQWLGDAGAQDEQAAFLAAFAAQLVATNPDRPTACQVDYEQISAIVEDLLGDGEDVPPEAVNVLRLCLHFLDRLEAALPSPLGAGAVQDGVSLIAEERRRQVREEGWSIDHDDKHEDGALAAAAACYAAPIHIGWVPGYRGDGGGLWPWAKEWDKRTEAPTSTQRIRELSKAGALCAAEITRLLRAVRTGGRARSEADSGAPLKEESGDHGTDGDNGTPERTR